VAGDEITTNIRQIRSVPLSAAFSRYGIQLIEIRGEVLMNKNNFKKYNEQLAEQNLPPLGQSPECGRRVVADKRSEGSEPPQPGSLSLSCQLFYT
jgi:hypothetical protein